MWGQKVYILQTKRSVGRQKNPKIHLTSYMEAPYGIVLLTLQASTVTAFIPDPCFCTALSFPRTNPHFYTTFLSEPKGASIYDVRALEGGDLQKQT